MKNQKAGRQVKLTDQDRKIITGLELNQHRKRKQSFIMHTENLRRQLNRFTQIQKKSDAKLRHK